MDLSHDNDILRPDKEDQLHKFYKAEYEAFLESKRIQEIDISKDDLQEAYLNLSNAYHKTLKKMMKITNIGDSTQYKLIKAQEAIRIQEEKLRAIFDNAIAGIVTLDLNGRFLSYNNNFQKMTEFADININQTIFKQCIYLDDRDIFAEIFENLVKQDIDHFRLQIRLTNRDEYFWSDVSASVIKNTQNQPDSVILVIADINDQVKTQNELVESYGRLKNAQQEIIKLERQTTALAMAVTANHEINQPLMIMKANLDMLNIMLPDELKTDKISRYIQRVDESVERIKRILDQFQKQEQVVFDDYGGNTTMVTFSEISKEYKEGSDSEPTDTE